MSSRTARFFALAGTLLLAASLAACGGSKKSAPPAAERKHGCLVVAKPPARSTKDSKPTAPLAANVVYEVTLTTNCGAFTIRLDQAQSPHVVASFVALARSGFFDETIFHRIARGFVIQGGDPTQTGNGGPGYTTVDRPPAGARYTLGVVAMAKTDVQPPGTSGSQFFVVTAANAGLPPDYAIIGKVVRGLAVVKRIGLLGNAEQLPTMVVEIEKATVSG
jgi:cyclophilin family peptidyl-prolyl cis-trans isomerase